MKNKALVKIAEGHRLMQEGYLELADCCSPEAKLEQAEGTEVSGKENKEQETKTEKKKVTIEQVRAVLAAKSQEGKTQAVKTLLNKYEAEKLSGVQPEQYEALMKDARLL